MDKILTSFDEGKKKVCKMIKLLLDLLRCASPVEQLNVGNCLATYLCNYLFIV